MLGEFWRNLAILNHTTRIIQLLHAAFLMSNPSDTSIGVLTGRDLILTGMGGIGGVFTIAETLKIPLIQAYVFPFTPTSEFPAPLVPSLPFGSLLNKLSFHIARQMFWQTSKISDNLTRQILGIPKASFWGPYASLNRRKVPALYGYSQHVLPRPHDWPEHHQLTGYWYLDTAKDWMPPSDLMDFLNAGQAPIYIGFGSMGSRNPEEVARLAIDALVRSGQRGVLASGWGGLKPSELPESIYLLDSLPHSWLFPRMAAVVHHGGAGTSAAGLRAGIPSIIIPFMGDQPFWARRIYDLGVGTKPIPRKQITTQRLADAITEAVSSDAIRQNAKNLGEKIRAEDSIANVVNVVRRYISA
jgi:sterol 3beta-glucosyltransferase